MPTFVLLVVVLVVLVYLLYRWLPAAPPAEPIVRKEPLFAVPTVSSVVPETEPGPFDANAHSMDQDDYLQVEFVVESDRAAIDALLEEVRRSAEAQRVGEGYARVVVRPEPPTPLRLSEISLEVIEGIFPSTSGGRRSLVLGLRGGTHSNVVAGFAWEVPGLGVVYGRTNADGIVTALGIDRLAAEPSMPARASLRAFTSRTGLAVVDWLAQRWL